MTSIGSALVRLEVAGERRTIQKGKVGMKVNNAPNILHTLPQNHPLISLDHAIAPSLALLVLLRRASRSRLGEWRREVAVEDVFGGWGEWWLRCGCKRWKGKREVSLMFVERKRAMYA